MSGEMWTNIYSFPEREPMTAKVRVPLTSTWWTMNSPGVTRGRLVRACLTKACPSMGVCSQKLKPGVCCITYRYLKRPRMSLVQTAQVGWASPRQFDWFLLHSSSELSEAKKCENWGVQSQLPIFCVLSSSGNLQCASTLLRALLNAMGRVNTGDARSEQSVQPRLFQPFLLLPLSSWQCLCWWEV